jgi:hypothetical protein
VLLGKHLSNDTAFRFAEPNSLTSIEEVIELSKVKVVSLENCESTLVEPKVTAKIEVESH